MSKTNLEIAIEYSKSVLSGEKLACEYIKLACSKFLNELDRKDLVFKEDEVDKVVTFINCTYLTEMDEPTHFYLEPWQTFIVCNIYGFYFKKTNIRKHRYIYIEVPRKNGKSQLISAIALYHLIFDKESQVVVTANSMRQARDTNYKKLIEMCGQLDRSKKYLKPYYSSIKCGKSELLLTASDASKLDGLNCSVGIVDELHEAKNSKMYDILKSSMGSRKEPLMIVITTSGFDTDSFCYTMRSYALDVLKGERKDDTRFTLVYTLDESDDYTDKNNWYKANPNLGVTVYEYNFEAEVNASINNPVEAHSVKVKLFNVWMKNRQIEEKYIDMEFVNNAMQPLTIHDTKFDELEVYVGADLGSVSDITAISYMIQLDDDFYFFNKYFLPEHSINSAKNRLQYKQWADEGYLTLTEGNVTDYNYITAELLGISKGHEIIQISYDSWNSTQWAIDATSEGLNLKPFSQSTGSINKPTKELSRLIMSGKVKIEYNPITLWMFNNVRLLEYSGNIRPDKSKKSDKIDGVMAMITCLGGYLASPRYSFGIY